MIQQFLEALFEQLEEHWIKVLTAALFMVVGWFFGRRKARRNWEKREFLDRLNVSLTRIVNGTIQIRTLLEKPTEEIFLNKVAVSELLRQAGKTIPGQPIIPLAKEDCWFYLNSVLNEISEQHSAGLLGADMGLPTTATSYLICLTNEAEGEVRTRKIRAMIVQKQLLTNLPAEEPKYERKVHRTRWLTLKHLAEAYQKSPHYFLEMEIVMPGQVK